MKFAKLVELILIAKLVKTILQFVNVNKIMSEIPFKDVDVNVNLQETALNLKNASNSNVYLFAEKEVTYFFFIIYLIWIELLTSLHNKLHLKVLSHF